MDREDEPEPKSITSRISVAYPDVFTGTQVRSKVDAPSNTEVTLGTLGEYYRYHFKVGNTIVLRGKTDNLARTELDLKKEHPTGHIVKIGRASAQGR